MTGVGEEGTGLHRSSLKQQQKRICRIGLIMLGVLESAPLWVPEDPGFSLDSFWVRCCVTPGKQITSPLWVSVSSIVNEEMASTQLGQEVHS